MRSLALSCLVLGLLAVCSAGTLQGTIDVKRLQTVLQEGLKDKDISTLYYSVKGLKLLNAKIPDVCNEIKAYKYDPKNVEQIFYLTNAAQLSGCIDHVRGALPYINSFLDKKDVTIPELYYATYAKRALGQGDVVNKDEALKNLIQLLKKDDSPANYGYVFTLCEHIGCEAWTATHAEGALLAADESDGKALHFEGGLPITSLLLTSIIRMLLGLPHFCSASEMFAMTRTDGFHAIMRKKAASLLSRVRSGSNSILVTVAERHTCPIMEHIVKMLVRTHKTLKKPTPLSEEQRLKFATYLVQRRAVTSPRGAALLLDAATAVADDEPTPISIAIKDKKYVTAETDSIEFSITDILGRPLKNLKPDEVVAQSGTRLADDVVVLSKQPLTQKSGEPTSFILNLSKVKAQYGLYKIALSAGSKTTSVNIAVLGEIQVNSVEVGVGDVDGTTSPKMTTLSYPNKLTEVLQADHLQKVTLKFTVKDKYNKPVLVQQAFVRVASAAPAGDEETIFVAEPDSSKAYKVDLNVGAIAKHLRGASGAYSLTIYLGDSAVSSPVAWCVGDVHLNFGKDAQAVGAPVRSSTSSQPHRARGPLPEIAHSFRAPEPRPPRAVSDVFALLCAAPLLLLLLLWATLRVNLAHFPFTPSALLFHGSTGGFLALYGMLWLKLSMFETFRYLLPLAAVTFLSGHRLLRRLVQDKQAR